MKPLSPYSHAHTVEDPKIREELIQQFKERGFDDTELWTLWETICKFIYPRLKVYIETKNKIHKSKLNKILTAFEPIEKDSLISGKDFEKKEEGLKLFAEHFFGLWF